MNTAVYFAFAVQQASGLERGSDRPLHELGRRVRAAEDVALSPCVDNDCTAIQNNLSSNNADSDGYIVEVNVVQYERASNRRRW